VTQDRAAAARVPGVVPGTPTRGRLLVFAATVLWGTSATLARYVFHYRSVPSLTVVELRLLVAVLLLGPYLALRRPALLKIEQRDLGYFLVLGLFGVASVQGSYYRSISVLGVGLAILLQYLAPVLIVVYDAMRGRRIPRVTWFAVGAAALGTALVVGNFDPAAIHARPLDWAVCFSSALWFAFYIVFSKRGLARYAPETVLIYTFTIAAVFWAFVTPPWKILAAGYDARLWTMFILLGIFSTLAPFSLFYAGLRYLSPTQAGIVATLEPVVAVLAAALLLGEGLRPLQWVGAALVMAAVAATSVVVPEAVPARAERG
jgi:drug/metabolite transporter (DMT)-like permease